MISSTNFLSKVALVFIFGILSLSIPSGAKEVRKEDSVIPKGRIRIAVFPVENLSGTLAPSKEIRQIFIEKLMASGFDVLDEGTLDLFMAKYRIRYTGGINREIAKAFKQEVGTDKVLITTLELYNDTNPPKISFISRLISTGDDPTISWIDGVGLSGDDARGLLDLGLIEDPKILLDKGMKLIFDSLNRYLSTEAMGEAGDKPKKKFRPKIFYRSPTLEPSRKYRVAIVPFFNYSLRKYAGDLMVLHFAKELKRFKTFDVIELGMVREVFLEVRIIMDQGISLADAESVLALLNADLILTGDVTDYEDYEGALGKPKVGFSVQLIERKSRGVVWSSTSYNQGDDGVFFFEQGKIRTAYTMASQMAEAIGKMMAK